MMVMFMEGVTTFWNKLQQKVRQVKWESESIFSTWIVSTESYSNPSTCGNSDSVSLDWVNEIEVLRIRFGVEIP